MLEHSEKPCSPAKSVTASNGMILYQNASATVTLLDIPHSIALAQGTSDHPSNKTLLSSPPLEHPWPSTEPLSEKAKSNVASHGTLTMRSPSTTVVERLMNEALVQLRTAWQGQWCLERKVKPEFQEPDLLSLTKSLTGWKSLESLLLKGRPIETLHSRDLYGRPVCNASMRSTRLLVVTDVDHVTNSSPIDGNTAYYSIPPLSTFILSSINSQGNGAFSMGALSLLPDQSSTSSAGPGEFDFVLLDPPWPNRSVRRSKSYETSDELMEALEGTLGPHIAPHGIVACWITNKPTSREAVMQAFDAWDIHLVEEWYWLKVTAGGLPVTDICGVWRKPYEVLLIGRKAAQRIDDGNVDGQPLPAVADDESRREEVEMKRRVIVAVPDVHSRKPCIKTLVEGAFGFEEGKYRAIEVFARNLTAGWWAWGDECMRFQWEGWWSSGDDSDDREKGAQGAKVMMA